MRNTTLAKRYAKALFIVGKEEDALDAYNKNLQEFAEACAGHAEVMDALTNPVYPLDVKEKVMDYLLQQARATQIVQNFLRLLVQKKRSVILPEIAEEFNKLVDEDRNVCHGKVVSAKGLTPELEGKVQATLEKITGKQVILETEVDPEIIGGIIARVGDMVLDGSLRTQLAGLKESIKGSE